MELHPEVVQVQEDILSDYHDGLIMLEQRLAYRLALLASRMGAALMPTHERHGLSVGVWRVMGVIGRYEPLSAKELARRTSTDPFRITRALAALSERKLVSRQADPKDRRRARLCLTRSGRRVHDEIVAEISQIESRVLGALSPREKTMLHLLLDKLDNSIVSQLPGEHWVPQSAGAIDPPSGKRTKEGLHDSNELTRSDALIQTSN